MYNTWSNVCEQPHLTLTADFKYKTCDELINYHYHYLVAIY